MSDENSSDQTTVTSSDDAPVAFPQFPTSMVIKGASRDSFATREAVANANDLANEKAESSGEE